MTKTQSLCSVSLACLVMIFIFSMNSCQGKPGSIDGDQPGTAMSTLLTATGIAQVPSVTPYPTTTTSIQSTQTVSFHTSLSTPNTISQLTSRKTSQPWWSEDGKVVYFSSFGPKPQTWAIELATGETEPRPDAQSPYQQALSEIHSLIPSDVPDHALSVSPSGANVVYSRLLGSGDSTERICDGEECWLVPLNEIWLVDVMSKQITQMEIEGELFGAEVHFWWSENENRIAIGVPASGLTGVNMASVWIADLLTKHVHLVETGNGGAYPLSISPDGSFVVYRDVTENDWGNDDCRVYRWDIDSSEEESLPGLPCINKHFWLPDSRAIAYFEKDGHDIVLWKYNTTTSKQREIIRTKSLPLVSYEIYWYAVSPEGNSVALVPLDDDYRHPLGIWLVILDP